ncbi:MAG TPA: DUF1573 domain-containing protein [Blastocatellia bacterium]|jgi:hypothetical protein|nr:DUF1573 domain-containing protein [Blastocatellia bacterium]
MKPDKIIAALTLALLMAIAAVAQSGPAPKIAIDSPTYDFGEIKAGTPLRHAFKVKNEGKADLEIKSVAPG